MAARRHYFWRHHKIGGPELPIARILLVDDFVPWHAVVKSLLKANPALQVIGTATSGMQAVMMARGLQPDVVLLDIDLPGMSGTEAAPHILRGSPKSKIVFLTVNDSASVQEAALRTGAHSYVLKSDAVHQLLPALEALLKQ
jgi:two-component system nitrate/nitrite response regulator NarL